MLSGTSSSKCRRNFMTVSAGSVQAPSSSAIAVSNKLKMLSANSFVYPPAYWLNSMRLPSARVWPRMGRCSWVRGHSLAKPWATDWDVVKQRVGLRKYLPVKGSFNS